MRTISFFQKTTIKSIIIISLIFIGLNANAQKEKLQTAFIYQLTRLIEWCPDGKNGNFVIGVVGNSPTLITELSALQSRKVATQQIEIKSFPTVADATKCNILFVPSSKQSDLKAAVAKIGTDCTLIISDQEGGADMGAGVSIVFQQESSKISYEISKRYMSKYSLNVNDQLYKLASRTY